MIGYLNGKPSLFDSDSLLIDVNGVGYKVFVAPKIMQSSVSDSTIQLWIHTHVREENLDLFGFLKKDELQLFKILISISGVGPRTAMGLMNFDAGEVKRAVATGDVEFFTQVPRLGKKNAQKIIIELKPKLGSLEDLDLTESLDSGVQDVIEALESMGFDKRSVKNALNKIDPGIESPEDKIRAVLKLLGK